MASLPPFKFKRNRVKRLYHGGNGIDRLRGESDGGDGRYPEDWIASCIDANAREFVAPGHGVSTCLLGDREVTFPELLADHAEALLGPEHLERYGKNPAVLCKLLDSSCLLPMQVHPDNVYAQRYFNSPYGKTEAWIILGTREINGEKPYLLLGFNDKLDQAAFQREVLRGAFEHGLEMLHKIEVHPGEVYVVHGRMPHAIGPGITMVEVMEPTDLMVIPERNLFGIELPDEKRYGGLTPEDALKIFDYTVYSREALIEKCCPTPELMAETPTGKLERIISRQKEKFFEAQRLTLSGEWEMDLSGKSFRIGIVVEGSLTLTGGGHCVRVKAGESFCVPYDTVDCCVSGNSSLLLVSPPL